MYRCKGFIFFFKFLKAVDYVLPWFLNQLNGSNDTYPLTVTAVIIQLWQSERTQNQFILWRFGCSKIPIAWICHPPRFWFLFQPRIGWIWYPIKHQNPRPGRFIYKLQVATSEGRISLASAVWHLAWIQPTCAHCPVLHSSSPCKHYHVGIVLHLNLYGKNWNLITILLMFLYKALLNRSMWGFRIRFPGTF